MKLPVTRRIASQIAAVVVLHLVFFLPALAAEGEGGQESSPMEWVFRWVNFLIIVGALGYFIAKMGRPAFQRRAETISGAIAQSGAVKAEAEQKMREAEGMLARLDQEVAELRVAAMRDAAAERERIRATAREEAAKVDRAAAAEVVAAERAALLELKAVAARLAVERAEADIRNRITPQAEEVLFRSFLGNLTRSVN